MQVEVLTCPVMPTSTFPAGERACGHLRAGGHVYLQPAYVSCTVYAQNALCLTETSILSVLPACSKLWPGFCRASNVFAKHSSFVSPKAPPEPENYIHHGQVEAVWSIFTSNERQCSCSKTNLLCVAWLARSLVLQPGSRPEGKRMRMSRGMAQLRCSRSHHGG